jgi:HAE1 family hydrophobic/amphiphilic exporter-1
MAVSTILGRFVIPIYYVLGERLIDHLARGRGGSHQSHPPVVEIHAGHPVPAREPSPVAVH